MQFYTLLTTLALVKSGIAGYAIQDDYSAPKFFDMFDFFTDEDPTHGFVKYVDQSTAESHGFVNTSSNGVYIGVDSTTTPSEGRRSVRLTSKASYNEGLVILDLAHMPASTCGTWPAFWMVGPNWPNSGEIDIIEGVNSQSANAMTLHTGPGCSISSTGGAFSGKVTTSDCDVNAADQAQNAGCSIDSSDDTTYGTGFNTANGGVYATEWTDSAISIWHFSRSNIPSDISGGSPDPSTWGTPAAQFSGDCDITETFKNQQIVFDMTFCGDWAGNVWSTDATCSSKASTCNDYVQNNPSAFADSYWQVNSLKVFKAGADTNTKPTKTSSSSSASKSSVAASSSVVVPVPATTLKTSTKASTSLKPTSIPAAASTPSTSIVSPPETTAAPPSTTSQAAVPAETSPQALQFGWFGQGNGIPSQLGKEKRVIPTPLAKEKRSGDSHNHMARHLKAHQRRFAHSHGGGLGGVF